MSITNRLRLLIKKILIFTLSGLLWSEHVIWSSEPPTRPCIDDNKQILWWEKCGGRIYSWTRKGTRSWPALLLPCKRDASPLNLRRLPSLPSLAARRAFELHSGISAFNPQRPLPQLRPCPPGWAARAWRWPRSVLLAPIVRAPPL